MSSIDDLKEYITRAKGITNDCRTFLWARLEHPESIDDDPSLELGGGNLLMASGLFATLGYLATIYVLLTGKEERSSRNDKEIIASDAFVDLMKDCPIKLGLNGLNEIELKKFWDRWRNQLTHRLVPGRGTALTISPRINPNLKGTYKRVIEDFLRDGELDSFHKTEDDWQLSNIDKLNAGIDRITKWVSDQSDSYPNKIESVLEWIKDGIE